MYISLGASERPIYRRNENLDEKISLYSGDITKLEIDAIVNAGKSVSAGHYLLVWINTTLKQDSIEFRLILCSTVVEQ